MENKDLSPYKYRCDYFDELYKKQTEEVEKKKAEGQTISIDVCVKRSGSETISESFECSAYLETPRSLLERLSSNKKQVSKLKKDIVVAELDGELFDLNRPIEKSCSIEFPLLSFKQATSLDLSNTVGDNADRRALGVYWHSCAHLLGFVLEKKFGGTLADGPATPKGFFYDAELTDEEDTSSRVISQADYETIEKEFLSICNDFKGREIQRVVLSYEEATRMFSNNQFKLEIIEERYKAGDILTAYKVGDFVDLCRGPHLPDTSLISAAKVMKVGSIYWKHLKENPSLQRIYGTAFPTQKLLDNFIKKEELLKSLDHRKLGTKLNLFFNHKLSPGSTFWLPKGALLYQRLKEYMRKKFNEKGYVEVNTPNIFHKDLWDISGHSANYAENMFSFKVDTQDFSLKPMNCPGHCLLFDSQNRSYKELPLRLFEFGILHRNELTGALSGLTRVRKFVQDDSHIYCTLEHVDDEINELIKFIGEVYNLFGFKFKAELSTKPDDLVLDKLNVNSSNKLENFTSNIKENEVIGDIWKKAEDMLKNCLDINMGGSWELNPGDGAFYGPKIDFKLSDKMGREHQCATIQLDFQTAARFGLKYSDPENKLKTPVIIHRAIMGSLERFIAILIEHYEGKFPFWLSPYQVYIVPITENEDMKNYCEELKGALKKMRCEVEIDYSSNSLNKKIVRGRSFNYCYIVCIGKKEVDNKTVTIRKKKVVKEFKLDDFLANAKSAIKLNKDRLTCDF